jgi:UDP-glucose 4-epimerase
MGAPITNGDIESAIKKVIPDAKVNLQRGKNPDHKKDAYMDTTRVQALGFKPKYTVDSAIAEYIEWLRAGNAV